MHPQCVIASVKIPAPLAVFRLHPSSLLLRRDKSDSRRRFTLARQVGATSCG